MAVNGLEPVIVKDFGGLKTLKHNCFGKGRKKRENGNSNHGAPQDSVLGPILFTFSMLPLGNSIQIH